MTIGSESSGPIWKAPVLRAMLILIAGSGLFPLRANELIERPRYVHTAWTIDQGLPFNWVQDLVQTRDGYLWIATEYGLARFDGVRFAHFSKQNVPSLQSNLIWAVAEDLSGALWVGTWGGGLSRFRDGVWDRPEYPGGFDQKFITSIVADQNGTLWVGTWGGGVVKLANGRWTSIRNDEGLRSDLIRSLEPDGGGGVWVGTENGLSRIDRDDHVHNPGTAGAGGNATVHAVLRRERGGIYVASSEGLYLLESDHRELVALGDMRSIAEDHGHLFVGAAAGLRVFESASMKEIGVAKIINPQAIRHDAQGNVWIASGGAGLHRIRLAMIGVVGAEDGLPRPQVSAVLERNDGSLVLGTTSGAWSLDADGLRTIGFEGSRVLFLREGSANQLWVGIEGGSLYEHRDQVWKKHAILRT